MIKNLRIDNLRGIRQGEVKDLAPLSVIVGPNNSGKSTIVEALYMGCGSMGAMTVVEVAKRRGWTGLDTARRLANTRGQDIVVAMDGDGRSESRRITVKDIVDSDILQKSLDKIEARDEFEERLQIDSIISPDIRSAVIVNAKGKTGNNVFTKPDRWVKSKTPIFVEAAPVTTYLEDAYSEAVGQGHESEITALVTSIAYEQASLRILKSGPAFTLHMVKDSGAIPVYLEGDGLKRVLYIACLLSGHIGELVLLEEPECFQHPAYLGKLASLITAAVRMGTQVVMTTHSLELLNLLFRAEDAPLEESAIFHTQLSGEGRLDVVRIPGSRAAERLDELGEDLRQ